MRFEGVESKDLQIQVTGGGQGLTAEFDLDKLKEQEALILAGGRWQRLSATTDSGSESASAAISIGWHQDAPARSMPNASKELLLDDLRALGYVR